MKRTFLLLLIAISLLNCTSLSGKYGGRPMTNLQKPVSLEKHGETRVDKYYWMRERDSKEVIQFLEDENARTEAAMKDTLPLQAQLVSEMRGRIQEEDQTVPVKSDDFYYYTRVETGKEYPIHCRKTHSLTAVEEVLINVNDEAKGHSYYSSTPPMMSNNHEVMAVGADSVGRRFYDIRFKNLKSGQWLADKLPATTGNLVWASDNKTVFYSVQHPETLRSYQIYRYQLGSSKSELVYEEKDETFSVFVDGSKDNTLLMINSAATLSSEVRWLKADQPLGQWTILAPREREHEYSAEWAGDRFVIVSNWKAKNFRLFEASLMAKDKSDWKEIVPHREDTLLEGVDAYKKFYVLSERFNGLTRLQVYDRTSHKTENVEFPDASYVAEVMSQPEYDSPYFRYSFESMIRPASVFDYDFSKKTSHLQKEKPVPNYDKSLYATERLWATASDGVKIPISIIYKKDRPRNAGPLVLYGYGSYGLSMEPWFATNSISLVNRGFAYAIAHIRGGSEMGRHWYDDGKLLKKMNTFTDFIAAGEFLVREKYTSNQHMYAIGGSAGGLLMGAVMNLRPDLFNGIVAQVPFVDVLTTMLDDSIPLTTSEYDEWGNPNDKTFYEYMRKYSPYDNVTAKNYPNLFVATGYHDSQVQYWEPAKWVAKIRELKTDKNLLLFKTEMNAGHSGASGRFERLKELANQYSFVLKLEGILK